MVNKVWNCYLTNSVWQNFRLKVIFVIDLWTATKLWFIIGIVIALMTAVLPGTSDTHRLAHCKAERAFLFFPPSWVAHTYLQGPWRSFQHSHCAFHIAAAITMLMLIGCSLCDPSEPQLPHSTTSRVLNYCHGLSITKCWQVVRNSGRKEARAKQKIIKILYWKGAERRNLKGLAKGDAGAWGHEALGSKSGCKSLLPTTAQPICQNICHFSLPLCNCNSKLINKLGTMNISKKKKIIKPMAKRNLVHPN